MLIEDNPVLTDIYKTAFEHAGLDVMAAHEGEAGLQLVRKMHPRVVLLDLLMPGADGFDVLRALKDDKTAKDIKIIVFTALDDKKSQAKAKKLGAVDYLVKSEGDPRKIIERIIAYF